MPGRSRFGELQAASGIEQAVERGRARCEHDAAQRAEHGASERFAVSPGHEAEGYLQVPGGNAGHPLSPYHGAGHAAWERGEPVPFLPGAPRWTLTLKPSP